MSDTLKDLLEMIKKHFPTEVKTLFTYKLAEYTLALRSTSEPQVIVEQEGEWLVPTPAGQIMAIPTAESNPDGISYIAFRNYEGEELSVFTSDEIREDTEFMLGALFGAFLKGAIDLKDLE